MYFVLGGEGICVCVYMGVCVFGGGGGGGGGVVGGCRGIGVDGDSLL